MFPPSGCLGIDVGGTKAHGIRLDAAGRPCAESVRPTRPGNDGVFDTIVEVVRDCLRDADAAPEVIGVGIPGQVDPHAGVVRMAVNLGITELDLGPRLSAALGVRVRVENDVKAAALGAAHFLGGDLAYVNFGTGVSGAAVVGGRLSRGTGNVAGEIGHFPIDPAGERCQCGQRGCIEVFAGGGRIAARLAALGGLDLTTLADAADGGNLRAVAEADRISLGIALAVQLMVLAHGSGRVALGGGVVRVAPGLVVRAQRLLDARAARSPFLASLNLSDRVTVISPELPVAVVGAALAGLGDGRSSLEPVAL